MSRSTDGTEGDLAAAAARSVGMVVLDDPEGLAPRISDILRNSADSIAGARRRHGDLWWSQGMWPFTQVHTRAGPYDGAGRPGSTNTTVERGPLRTPVLGISAYAVDGMRMAWRDPVSYLLDVARLVEGGDGRPTARDLRRVAIASTIIAHEPAHARDLPVVFTATAFEPVHVYDEALRHADRMESRILRVSDEIWTMMEALPRITRVTLFRGRRNVPEIGIGPFADALSGNPTERDHELVGWRGGFTRRKAVA